MNKINFNQTGGFPLTTETLNFLQNSFTIFNAISGVTGDLAILSGCTVAGNSVADGVVVIGGELFPFKGGTLGKTVIIKEETLNRTFENGEEKEVFVSKIAQFGVGAKSYPWADFKRLSDLPALEEKLKNLQWKDIGGKPEKFPPEDHRTKWNEIDGKPTTFPPATHKHTAAEITGLPRVAIAGRVACNPRQIIATFVGSFAVQNYNNRNDYHRIVHNLGHTRYIVTGNAFSKNNIKFVAYQMTADSFVVATSDDDSTNASDFDFQITVFD